MRLGLDGVITGNAMYADVMARLWDMHERRQLDPLRDLFGKFLLMRNLNDHVPGADLYIMRKRGVFKTLVTRTAAGPKTLSFSPVLRAFRKQLDRGLAGQLHKQTVVGLRHREDRGWCELAARGTSPVFHANDRATNSSSERSDRAGLRRCDH